jgi:hypothetical protein
MKRICIHQPDFVPYLGFFDRLIDSDVYVVYDDVQFHKTRWHHRDKIKTPRGPAWLTLPVQKPEFGQFIAQIRLAPDRDRWVSSHLALLSENYRKAPYFADTIGGIEHLYRTAPGDLSGFNMAFIRHMLDVFDLSVEIVTSSSLACDGTRNGRLVEIVKAVGGTHYLSGTGALDYLEPGVFEDAGIRLEMQDFRHPVYPQQFEAFEPYLSCLDLLFNCGPDAATVLRQERGPKRPY